MSGKRIREGTGPSSLGHRVASAAGWMVALRWIDRLIGIASIAILARVLLPEDFGIVGYATLVIGILELFTGLSTDAELIRQQDAERGYYDAAWSMNILRGLAIGSLMIALAGAAADFFREPRLGAVMLALAVIPILHGFENIGVVDFRKRLELDREFRYLLTTRLLGTAAAIALAFALHNYWALVIASIVRTALGVGLSYRFHPFRPRWALARVPEMFRFSRWMMLQNLLAGVNDKLPALVIGRAWGSSPLAFFNIGKEIAQLATTEIGAPVRRVLYPGLAQVAGRHARVGDILVESTGVLALLTLPIPLGIALVAEDLVPLFLGAQWGPTVTALPPLCVAAAASALGTNSQLAYMALNRAHLTAITTAGRLLLLAVLLIAVPASHGIVGVAYAVAAANCVTLVADHALTARILGIGAGRFVAAIWRPVAASLAMCGSVWLVRSGFAPAADLAGHFWSLARSTLLGAAVYAACVFALWTAGGRREGAERRLIAIAAHWFDRRGRNPR